MSGTRGGSNDAGLPLIATEEIAGEQYQKVKLVSGTAGETAAVGGDAANGLDVDVTRVQGTVTVDASGTAVPVTDNGGTLTVDGAVTVSATDLDIRALSSVTDSVSVTGSVSAYVSGQVGVVAGEGPPVDTRALTQTTDSVAIGDGTTILPVLDVGEAEYGIRVRLYPGNSAMPVQNTTSPGSALEVMGRSGHGAAWIDQGSLAVGGKGVSSTPSPVNNGETVRAYYDLTGHQHVKVDRSPICGTGTNSTVAASATSVTILSSNAGRLGASIFNDSTVALYLDLSGGTATTSSFTVKVAADGYYEVPFGYTGTITGLWASATGNARVTQMTA